MPDGGGANSRHRAPMRTPNGVTPPSGRGNLGRELIIAEAVRFIDQSGQDRLTMRRLGAGLNVEAMALYRYVPGREQLLDGVVEYVMNELYDTTMTGELTSSWQEYLQHTARGCGIGDPGLLPRRGSGHRCAASAGSKASLRVWPGLASRLSRACWSIVPLPRFCSVTYCSRPPHWLAKQNQRSRVTLRSRTPRTCPRIRG